jgi:hypothetical protein
MKARAIRMVLGAAALAALHAGCIGDGTDGGEVVEMRQGAILGVDQFLYFRSNATGWGVDETTRLFPFVAPTVFARLYNVTQPWMVSDADTAIVTLTNQLDGWGTSQTFYGATSKRLVVPALTPATDTLTAQVNGGDEHFKIKYPAEGECRVLVNFASSPPSIQIDTAASACTVNCPSPLHCALTSPEGRPTCVQ